MSIRFRTLTLLAMCAALPQAVLVNADQPAPVFQVPPGFVVERVAGPPLVRYSLFAAFDDRGGLYVAEGTGTNLPGPELVPKKLGRITLLEDTDGDGTFDKSTPFAEELIFPQGVLWHDGAVYVASHPSIWRLEDTDGDGRADRREELVTRFNFNGNGCDIHGPFLGPDGRLYWTDGRHGYQVRTREGATLEGLASRIWRCNLDGTQIERVSGGGFDNPVELAFMPDGEMIGTMDQGPGDALLHYVEGGVYPMEHPSLSEFTMTGPMLGSVKQYTAALPVALCGLARYRSTQLGTEYQGSLFSAQFNVHRIEQHTLVRDGGTFRSVEKDFVTSNDYSVHLSDVLEDADGSLLFVDMGAWFNYGCPTSKIARPEILGAIYRVRRTDASVPADPWGIELKLRDASTEELIPLLADARSKVQDAAVARLARLGEPAVPALANMLHRDTDESPAVVQARQNAVWALCRIDAPEAREAQRELLQSGSEDVILPAVHAVGLWRDQEAILQLGELVVEGTQPLRLKAAEALGRLGKSDAVPAILESLRRGANDRFVEHALIYALIQIHHRPTTLAGLADANPRVRQAALIALDQMPHGDLTQELVTPLLDTDDPDLRQAALDVISKRPEWAGQTLGLLSEWLAAPSLTDAQEQSLTGAMLAFSGEEPVQRLAAEALADAKTPPRTWLAVLRVLGRARIEPLPDSWREVLDGALSSEDLSLRREAIAAVQARGGAAFDARLVELARAVQLPAELRIAAVDALAGRQAMLNADVFALLKGHLSEETEPLLRVAAARALGASPLERSQLLELANHLAGAGPLLTPLLAPAFAKSSDAEVGLAFVAALEKSSGVETLSAADFEKLLSSYPAEVHSRAQPLRDQLAARQEKQADYLAQLTSELLRSPGSAEHGKAVFFSKRAACYACHRAAGAGGVIGPDLSQVGRFRTSGDLLESIVFPSSSVVPHFRSYQVATTDGRIVSGLILRQNSASISLVTPQLAELHLARDEVAEMSPSDLSLMPQGLEKVLPRQDLRDLLEFLFQQR